MNLQDSYDIQHDLVALELDYIAERVRTIRSLRPTWDKVRQLAELREQLRNLASSPPIGRQ